jgi:hypothetical protein
MLGLRLLIEGQIMRTPLNIKGDINLNIVLNL